MKRLLIALVLLITPSLALALGTVTVTGPTKLESQVYTVTYTWTADAANGSVPATAGPSVEGLVVMAVTDPGSTAPTDNYDITFTNPDGADVFGGELVDRDTSNTEQAAPLVGNSYGQRYVKGPLTLNITNNSVNSATGTVKVYVYSIRER